MQSKVDKKIKTNNLEFGSFDFFSIRENKLISLRDVVINIFLKRLISIIDPGLEEQRYILKVFLKIDCF